MLAQPPPQSLVQQVRRRMVRPQGSSSRAVDPQFQPLPDRQPAVHHFALVDIEVTWLLMSVGYHDFQSVSAERHAGIALLAATLGIEGSLVGNEGDLRTRFRGLDLAPVSDDGLHDSFRSLRIIAKELRSPDAVVQLEPEGLGSRIAGAGPGRAGCRPLALHRLLIAGNIGRPAWPRRMSCVRSRGKP